MKNIFEKLDLSGIEKAVMEDDCTIEYCELTIESRELVIKNENGIISKHYGLNTSFIPMISMASQDYGQNEKVFCYNENRFLQSIIDLQCSKMNILIIKKEKDSFNVTLADMLKNPIVSISNKSLAQALNALDSYIGNLTIKDLLYLHKNCLNNTDVDNLNDYSKNKANPIKRIRK